MTAQRLQTARELLILCCDFAAETVHQATGKPMQQQSLSNRDHTRMMMVAYQGPVRIGGCLLNVDVLPHDGRRLASELQCDRLQLCRQICGI